MNIMKIINTNISANLLIILLVFLIGCTSTDECRDDLAVNLKAGFYKHSNLVETSFSVDSVWVNGLEKDSFLYKNIKTQSSIKFELNAARQQSDFIVQFNDIKDTIAIYYTNNNSYFISLPCGCISTHTISEVISTHHYIDSIRIIQPEVLNVNAEHIKIFHN